MTLGDLEQSLLTVLFVCLTGASSHPQKFARRQTQTIIDNNAAAVQGGSGRQKKKQMEKEQLTNPVTD